MPWTLRFACLLLAMPWTLSGCGEDETARVPTAAAVHGDFAVGLTVTGEIKAVKSVKIVAPSLRGSSKIVELADAATLVHKGDVVCRFDTGDTERERSTTQAEIGLAEQKIALQQQENANNLANLERGVVQAQLRLDQANLGVTDSDTVSRIEKERTRIEGVQAKLDLEKARQDLEAARTTGEGNVEQLRLELRKLKDQLQQIDESLGKAVMTAPTDGLVIPGKTWRGGVIAEGDEVWGGQTIMELPDLGAMEVKAWVHEVDAAQVRMDQQAEVRLDTFPDRVFTGTVKKIADLAATRAESSTIKYFEVTVELQKTDPVMKPGMTAKVDISVDRLKGVVSIPREAVQEGADGPVVWVRKGSGRESRPVELGKRNASHVVVVRGITAGEEVYLADPDSAPGDVAAAAGNPKAGAGAADSQKGRSPQAGKGGASKAH